MAYKIDFTASNYVNRSRRKAFLRLLLLVAVAGTAWGLHEVHRIYNLPTLNMKLADFEAAACPIEEISRAWDDVAREFGATMRYYRLAWAESPTNFLNAMSASDATILGRAFRPSAWTLKTGGECRLDYRYVFNPGDKAEQAKGVEAMVVNAVTSTVTVVSNNVVVQGVQLENLLNVDELQLTVGFSLPDEEKFPAKNAVLSNDVNEVAAMRKKVQEMKVPGADDGKGVVPTAKKIMMDYLTTGKEKPDFPVISNVVNVAGWFDRADKFVAANDIHVNDEKKRHELEKMRHELEEKRYKLKEAWNKIGNARFPWDRVRSIDNDELVNCTKALETDSDLVKRFKFKDFLSLRRARCRKMLKPLIEAYDHDAVFNEPLIESDLKDRIAKVAGIADVQISFKSEPDAEPANLMTEDNEFSFTWVRWTLVMRNGQASSARATEVNEESGGGKSQLTLEKVADCAKRTIELGPGYAIDTVKVNFGEDGSVSDASMDGLLPVKKKVPVKKDAPAKKEAKANVD